MPVVTYIGRSHMRRASDPKMPDWEQNRPVEVTTAWVDRYAPRLDELNFRIEGWTATEAEERSEDLGNDGIPDEAWSRKDIQGWLATYDIKPKGYATKSTLLELVATVMSPDGVAETEELVAESKEEEE
jgi:hypothetical protein